MPARFDSIQNRMVTKVNNLYAYPGSWTPSNNAGVQTGEILFKNPTHGKDLSGLAEYDPMHILAEYKIDQFPGLREMANTATNKERITVDGVEYYVRQVNKKYDGKTLIAILEMINGDQIELDEELGGNDTLLDAD